MRLLISTYHELMKIRLAYLLRLASFPRLPILRIIMLAEDTVEDNEMLSVDMFFILNRLFFCFPVPISLGAVAVRSVSARLISLPIPCWWATAKGALGGGRSEPWGGVIGGVADRVDVSDGEAKVGLEVYGDALYAEAGVLVCFLGVVASLSRARLSRLRRPPPLFVFSGEGRVACESGDGREEGTA